jgi:hypothetical protein
MSSSSLCGAMCTRFAHPSHLSRAAQRSGIFPHAAHPAATAGNGCGRRGSIVPDGFGGVSFRDACDEHDWCYQGAPVSRSVQCYKYEKKRKKKKKKKNRGRRHPEKDESSTSPEKRKKKKKKKKKHQAAANATSDFSTRLREAVLPGQSNRISVRSVTSWCARSRGLTATEMPRTTRSKLPA